MVRIATAAKAARSGRGATGRPRSYGSARNTGITIFEAPDEEAARRFMEEDPVIAGGFAIGELRPFRVSLLRGRD